MFNSFVLTIFKSWFGYSLLYLDYSFFLILRIALYLTGGLCWVFGDITEVSFLGIDLLVL